MTGDTPAAQASALDVWRSRLKEIADRIAQPIDVRVLPGEPELWMRCRRIDPDELNRIADASESMLDNNVDAIIAACQGLYEGRPATGRLVAERFDLLADQLGVDAADHRAAVRAVFADDYALLRAGGELTDHFTAVEQQAEQRHAGE